MTVCGVTMQTAEDQLTIGLLEHQSLVVPRLLTRNSALVGRVNEGRGTASRPKSKRQLG